MKICLISDTHGGEPIIEEEGDIIIHAGDVTRGGSKIEVIKFINWFSSLPYKHKIFVAGNHDKYLEIMPKSFIQDVLCPSDTIYLEHETIVLEGLKIFGSPMSPRFFNWSFMYDKQIDGQDLWMSIEEETDIVITHSPPKWILDEILSSRLTADRHVGCEYLNKRITDQQPKIHVFGHIHEAYGKLELEHTTFYNASIMNHKFLPENKPFYIEL
jgi:Icc-related predicted phosphoesterase